MKRTTPLHRLTALRLGAMLVVSLALCTPLLGLWTQTFKPQATYTLPGDYDGDSRADPCVFYPVDPQKGTAGWWHILKSTTGQPYEFQYGGNGPKPVPGDYDGDGIQDLAVYNQANGTWYILQSTAGERIQGFGWSEANPVPADYDGDGRTDIAVYHPAAGQWYLLKSTEGFETFAYGWAGPVPVPADYDGDGRADPAVYHQAAGRWYLRRSALGHVEIDFGWSAAAPVPADYDGDLHADIAVYHEAGKTWYILASSEGFSSTNFPYLTKPVQADYDGDSRADIAVYNPANGNWCVAIPNRHFVSVEVINAGYVTPGSGYYEAGSVQTFNQTAEPDWAFVEWTVDGVRQQYPNGKAIDPLPLAVDAPHSVRAEFLEAYRDNADDDGLPDWWERYYFGSTAPAPEEDPDGDGISNLQEYRKGTDPREAPCTFAAYNDLSWAAGQLANNITHYTSDETAHQALEIRVAVSSDDAEEGPDSGMHLASSDLELVEDGGIQTVGIRFPGVGVPRGATIVKAYVQFKTDETGSAPTTLRIQGQAADNAATFSAANGDITGRPRTGAGVWWQPPEWDTVGEAGDRQRTPDLSAVVQEIVNRPGWQSQNALAVIMTGSGRRTAEAYDGDHAGAPLLHIEYVVQPLKDYATGQARPETLAVTGGAWNGGSHTTEGSAAEAGTDAHSVFAGKVDCTGVISYGNQVAPVRLAFAGLDPQARYEIVLFGNRNEPACTGELSRCRIAGADRFVNLSSANVRPDWSGTADTVIAHGYNTAAGYVARYTLVEPGADGRVDIIVRDGGSAVPPKPYINAVALRQIQAEDSDLDGMDDRWEIANGLNPGQAADKTGDDDQDGLSNEQEHAHNTNPNAADTDGDEMPDAYELAHALNPLDRADAGADNDGDGANNYAEYFYGTPPDDPLGLPPFGSTVPFVFQFGDDSGSRSEAYSVHVGPYTLENTGCGIVDEITNALPVGRTYAITLQHEATTLNEYPDYDYTIDWWPEDEHFLHYVQDVPPELDGSHGTGGVTIEFEAEDAAAYLTIFGGQPNLDVNLPEAKCHRVSLLGVPLPDPAPTGEAESDHAPNKCHVDMYSLAPHYSVSDVAVPLVGGELQLEFRRSLALKSYSKQQMQGGKLYINDLILGPGWSTSLGAHIATYTETVGAQMEIHAATVVDDLGSAYTYHQVLGAYVPAVFFSMNCDALRGRLSLNGGQFAFTRKHGTTCTYELAGEPGGAGNRTYYRLVRAEDANGNALLYTYQHPANGLLVTRIREEARPAHKIEFGYIDIGVENDPARTGWRLSTVTDPAGKITTYEYYMPGETDPKFVGCLKAVKRMPVPNADRPGDPAEQPVVTFAYTILEYASYAGTAPGEGFNQNAPKTVYVAPRLVTDARGGTTEFTYYEDPDVPPVSAGFPSSLRANGRIVVGRRPLLHTVTTAKGTPDAATATFVQTRREINAGNHEVLTSVTDAREPGVTTGYSFLGRLDGEEGDEHTLFITQVDRAAGGTQVTFAYEPNVTGNLVRVTGVTGTQIEYQYARVPGGYDHALWANPSAKIVDPTGLQLTTTYAYDAVCHKLTRRTDPMGTVTSYELDAYGNTKRIVEAEGTPAERVTAYAYDYEMPLEAHEGFVRRSTDPDGRVTEFTKDAFGYVGARIVRGYNEELALTTVYGKDAMGNDLFVTDPRGNTTACAYDDLHRLQTETLPAVEDPDNPGQQAPSTVSHVYDLNGNSRRVRVANGGNTQVTVHTYDAMNRLTATRIRMVEPDADNTADIVTRQGYTPIGQVEWSRDANGNQTAFIYDALTRMTRKTLPNSDCEQYAYGQNAGLGAFGLGGWQPTRVVNPRGYAADTTFDAALRPVKAVRRFNAGPADPAGAPRSDPAAGHDEPATELAYNDAGLKVSETVLADNFEGAETRNQTTYLFYDHAARLTATVVDMDGDGPGTLDPLTVFVDDPVAETGFDPDDIVTRTVYDGAGNVVTNVDANGNMTVNVYDGAGRLTRTVQPEVQVCDPVHGIDEPRQPTSEFAYDENGNRTWGKDPNGNETQNTYDARNRLTVSILDRNADHTFDPAPAGADVVTRTVYDFAGNAVRSIDPNGNLASNIYDRAWRVLTNVAPAVLNAATGQTGTPITVTEYDKNGNVRFLTDAEGVLSETAFDCLNRPVDGWAARGTGAEQHTRTEYDANGNVAARTLFNPGHDTQTTAYEYDPYDRCTAERVCDGLPQQRLTTHSWYRNGAIRTVTDPKGQATECQYDRAGRPSEKRFKRADASVEETQYYQYDAVGNVTHVDDRHGYSAYWYDALSRLSYELRSDAGYPSYYTASAYDANGNRTRCVHPWTGRTLTSHYDARNALTRLVDSDGARETTYAYDKNGNQRFCTTPNGVVTENTFDAISRVTTRSVTKAAANIYTVSYGYDRVGNRLAVAEDIAQQGQRLCAYTYDSAYRLTAEAWTLGATSESRAYTYDAAGNRLAMTHVLNGAADNTAYTHDALNQLVAADKDGAVTLYTYDVNGNRQTKSAGAVVTTYEYDTHNRLVSAEQGGQTVFEAAYDYRTRRLTKKEAGDVRPTYFRYDRGDCIQEMDLFMLKTAFIRGSGLGGGIGSILYSDRSGTKEYFAYSAVGHTVALTDDNGAAVKTDLYEAFGNITSSTGDSPNNRLANTKERDSSIGLDNHGFRYYDPEVGRYLTRDPAGYVDGVNVYLHVHNNPVNHVDPLGLMDAATARASAWVCDKLLGRGNRISAALAGVAEWQEQAGAALVGRVAIAARGPMAQMGAALDTLSNLADATSRGKLVEAAVPDLHHL
ncbi:MAG: hypothetical protein JXR37_19845, partial [Kiritimatiellae bacterium]|nr:hypothetical protein [Kiritimatiellia bacterium]